MTIISLYPLNTCAVSASDSPLAKDELPTSVISLTFPPSKLKDAPKLILVLVLGSKNIFPSIAPSRTRVIFSFEAYGSNLSATENNFSISERSN